MAALLCSRPIGCLGLDKRRAAGTPKRPYHTARAAVLTRATDNQGPSSSDSGASSPTPSPPSTSDVEYPEQLTTWKYGKTRDPGFAPWFVGMCFFPFLLLLVPLLQTPPPPPGIAPGL